MARSEPGSFCNFFKKQLPKIITERSEALVFHRRKERHREVKAGRSGQFRKDTDLQAKVFLVILFSSCRSRSAPKMSINIVSSSRIQQLLDARDQIATARAEVGEGEGPLFTTNAPNVPYGVGLDSPWFQSKDGPRNRVKKDYLSQKKI
jgi:hypothetical protein